MVMCRWLCGGLAFDHMRFMHHVIKCSWLITAHAQCAVISQCEATQELALRSGICSCGYLCIDRRNQLCGRLFRSIRESCLVTDPSEVFLPRYGSASLRTPQKCCFGQVRDLSFLIGVDCVMVGVSMITWLTLSCTPTSLLVHPQP